MDFITFLQEEFPRILRRYFWIFLLFLIAAGAAAYFYINSQPNAYEARAKLLIGPGMTTSTPDLDALRIGGELIQTYAELAETRPVMETVIEDLDLNMDPVELNEQIEISVNADTRIMTITVTSNSKKEAVAIANSLADVIYDMSPSGNETAKVMRSQLQQHAVELESIITETERYINQLKVQLASLPDFAAAGQDGTNIDAFDRQEYLRVRLGDLRIELSYALRAQAEIYNVLKERIYSYTADTLDARDRLIGNAEDFDKIIDDMENEVAKLEGELEALDARTNNASDQYDVFEQQRIILDQLATERDRLADSLLAQTNIIEILEITFTNEVTIVEPAVESILVDKQIPFVVLSASLAGLVLASLVVWTIEIFGWKKPVVHGAGSKKEESGVA